MDRNPYHKMNRAAPRQGLKPLGLCTALLWAMVALLGTSTVHAAAPEFEIKLATLAPENSSLMKIFNEMNAEVIKETGGRVGFKMFAGFVLGDEEDVLRKLRIGMIHAATFTTTALSDIQPGLRVFHVPFFFNSFEEVDYALQRVEDDLKRGFSERGYEVLGWPEVGFLYFMSTNPVAGISDLKGKKVWAKANAPMPQAIINRIEVSTVAINVPDVLVALQTNLLDVVYNSPYYALVTQWYTQIKYFTDLPLSYVGGVLLVDKKVFAKIPAPLQETVKRVCAKHLRALVEKTRKDNADALGVMLGRGIKKVTPDTRQVEEFKDLSSKAMADLGPDYLPKAIDQKVRAALAEYRSGGKR